MGVGNDARRVIQQLLVSADEYLLDRGHAIGHSREFVFSLAADDAIVKRRFISGLEQVQAGSPLRHFVDEVRAIGGAEQLSDNKTGPGASRGRIATLVAGTGRRAFPVPTPPHAYQIPQSNRS